MIQHNGAGALAIGLFLVVASGCDSQPPGMDASLPIDAATIPDAGADDAAMGVDAGQIDAGQIDAGQALPARIQSIVDTLRPAMYDCPDRVWPGIASAYRGSQILLVDEAGGHAYLFNDRRGSPSELVVTRLSTDELESAWLAALNVGYVNGALTLGVSLDWTGELNDSYDDAGITHWHDWAARIAAHEAFHFLSGQTAWSATTTGRYQYYPEAWKPRYLRAALGRSLLDIVRGNTGASPRIARYWLDRFEMEHPEAAARIAGTDVIEGSANYAEMVSAALGELGCDASPSALRDAMTDHLNEFATFESFHGDGEAYALGAAAGLPMRSAMLDGWESMVASGTPPASVLLADEVAAPVPDDPVLMQKARDAVAERNASNAMEIEPMLARMDSPDYYRLPLSGEWLAGSFSSRGFYILTERAGAPEAIVAMEATFILPSADRVVLEGQNVVSPSTTPCPGLESGGVFIAQIARADVAAASGEHTSSATGVVFTELTATLVDSDGLEWLCPTISE